MVLMVAVWGGCISSPQRIHLFRLDVVGYLLVLVNYSVTKLRVLDGESEGVG
jgi:hypothetical protein